MKKEDAAELAKKLTDSGAKVTLNKKYKLAEHKTRQFGGFCVSRYTSGTYGDTREDIRFSSPAENDSPFRV